MPFPIPNSDPAIVYKIWKTPADVPISLVGDAAINIGLFVKSILEQSEKTLSGNFVIAATKDMTARELASTWTQRECKKVVYLEIEKNMYYSMWPKWGEAMDRQHMMISM